MNARLFAIWVILWPFIAQFMSIFVPKWIDKGQIQEFCNHFSEKRLQNAFFA